MGRRWTALLASRPRLQSLVSTIQPYLPPLNYITLHYAYFTIVCLVASIIFYVSSSDGPGTTIGYVDALFLVVSAMTEAGLNTVNLSEMNTWQQVLLLILIILGSAIWVSIWTVLARKHVFEQRFEEIVEGVRMQRLRRRRTEPIGGKEGGRVMNFGRGSRGRGPCSLGGIEEEVAAPDSSDGDGSGGSTLKGIDDRETGIESSATGSRIGKKKLLHRASTLPDLERGHASDGEDEDGGVGPGPNAGKGSRPPGGPHIAFAGREERHPLSSAAASSAYEHHSPTTTTSTTRRRAVEPLPQNTNLPDPPSWSPLSFLSRSNNVSRNAGFYNLSDDEKEAIGGCEYRALKLLSWTVTLYFILFQALGGIAVGAYISSFAAFEARGNGANPWWSGIYYGISAFNNSGMSLLDANMVPFQQSPFVLLVVGFLILAGNTAFPILLRLTLWTMLKFANFGSRWCVARGVEWREWTKEMEELRATLEFILKYPRRVYTNLFPGRATWWLLFMLIWLNGVDWVAFIVMNIGNKALEAIPAGYRALDGLFQALAVRSGGFFVVPIPDLYIGLQLLYAIMMYVSVYPVVITMRHSNVYEERSLGIYTDEEEDSSSPSAPEAPPAPPMAATAVNAVGAALKRTMTSFNGVGAIRPPPKFSSPFSPEASNASEQARPPPVSRTTGLVNLSAPPDSRVSFIRQQVRGQLAHDLWWLVAAVFIIVTIETGNFLNDPLSFSVFNVMFEVISAYGCVGISVGSPGKAYSFCGAWSKASKIILCLVMLRGRHRGLPVALDRAVRLPGERLLKEEEEDWRIRTGAGRRASTGE
ncbi:hypothetical protein MKZ38_003973 [Zalerion maritima]|uniref:Potassium transport protein n=1 Tax=Zalerion maritima TaxID=339359 RepID=A0AAD5RNF8_9PEZI|nr:hypothetical protein MKZ38_003973 [Zalerion maritima]